MKKLELGDWLDLVRASRALIAAFDKAVATGTDVEQHEAAPKELEQARKALAASVMDLGPQYCRCGPNADNPCFRFVLLQPDDQLKGWHVRCSAGVPLVKKPDPSQVLKDIKVICDKCEGRVGLVMAQHEYGDTEEACPHQSTDQWRGPNDLLYPE